MAGINLVQTGTVIIIIGLIVVMAGLFMSSKPGSAETKFGFGGFIGPLPFGFANDKTVMYIIGGLMVLTIIAWFLLMHYK